MKENQIVSQSSELGSLSVYFSSKNNSFWDIGFFKAQLWSLNNRLLDWEIL